MGTTAWTQCCKKDELRVLLLLSRVPTSYLPVSFSKVHTWSNNRCVAVHRVLSYLHSTDAVKTEWLPLQQAWTWSSFRYSQRKFIRHIQKMLLLTTILQTGQPVILLPPRFPRSHKELWRMQRKSERETRVSSRTTAPWRFRAKCLHN